MVKYVQEDEFSEVYVIHEKSGKLKAYYPNSEIIIRYEEFCKYIYSKKNTSKIRSFNIKWVPQYASTDP